MSTKKPAAARPVTIAVLTAAASQTERPVPAVGSVFTKLEVRPAGCKAFRGFMVSLNDFMWPLYNTLKSAPSPILAILPSPVLMMRLTA
ncbi:MAG: hypothetical protein ABSE90_00055 [Verrucomicrobiota bacterium]|jgi:hypothetical protein